MFPVLVMLESGPYMRRIITHVAPENSSDADQYQLDADPYQLDADPYQHVAPPPFWLLISLVFGVHGMTFEGKMRKN